MWIDQLGVFESWPDNIDNILAIQFVDGVAI
jgi:hypothetical protein